MVYSSLRRFVRKSLFVIGEEARETSVFEQYIARNVKDANNDDDPDALTSRISDHAVHRCASARSCDDVFADRSESASSDSEFFSLEEDELSDTSVDRSVGTRSPPLPPPPLPESVSSRKHLTRHERLRRVSRSTSQPHLPADSRHNVPHRLPGVASLHASASAGPGAGIPNAKDRPTGLLGGRTISTHDRLVQTHPVWYLPSVGRAGAVHLLHDREEGVFIVRQASQPDNLALSVRVGRRPNIEHFLLECSSRGVRVGDSQLWFPAIPSLCTHYINHRDDLPTRLVLPAAISEAKSHQELASIAVLCQDFWTSPISLKQPVIRSVYRTSVNVDKPESQPTQRPSIYRKSVSRHSSFVQQKPPALQRMANSVRSSTTGNHLASSNHSINLPVTTPAAQQILGVVSNGQSSEVDPNKIPPSSSSSSSSSSQPRTEAFASFSSRSCDALVTNGARTVSQHITSTSNGMIGPKHHLNPNDFKNGDAYNKPLLQDRLSDYEDVWNSRPISGIEGQPNNPFFRPIQNGSLSDDSASSQAAEASPRRRKLRAGRNARGQTSKKKRERVSGKVDQLSDSESDRPVAVVIGKQKPTPRKWPQTNPPSKQQQQQQQKLHQQRPPFGGRTSVQQTEGIKTSQIETTMPTTRTTADTVNKDPIVFTFDFDGMTIEPRSGGTLEKNCPVTISPFYNSQASPAYAQPYDTLIGKMEGISETLGTIRVSNTLKKNSFRSEQSLPTSAKAFPEHPPQRFTSKLEIYQPALTSSQSQTRIYDQPTMSTGEIITTLPRGGFKVRPVACTKKKVPPLPLCYQVPHDSKEHVFHMNRSQSLQCLGVAEKYGPRAQSMCSESQRNVELLPGKPLLHNHQLENQTVVGVKTVQHSPPTKSTNHYATSPRMRSEVRAFVNSSSNSQSLETFLKPTRLEESPPKRQLNNKFPMRDEDNNRLSKLSHCFSDTSTVEDLIHDVSPELTMKPIKPLTKKNLQRMSEYDNLSGLAGSRAPSKKTAAPSSTGTNYCTPWDSSRWQELVDKGSEERAPAHIQAAQRLSTATTQRTSLMYSNSDTSSIGDINSLYDEDSLRRNSGVVGGDLVTSGIEGMMRCQGDDDDRDDETTPTPQTGGAGMGPVEEVLVFPGKVESSYLQEQLSELEEEMVRLARASSVSDDEGVEEDEEGSDGGQLEDEPEQFKPLLSTPRLLSMPCHTNSSGAKVRDMVSGLASNSQTTFGRQVDFFVKCTLEGSETNPGIVVRNVRQFMNGIKNYLVKHGESEFHEIVEKERSMLGADQFLNVDAMIEGALHRCIVKPLKQHIYKLYVEEYKRNGNLRSLSDNIKYARNMTPYELGIKSNIAIPQAATMDVIKHFLDKMQKSYSPLEKVENLLGATSTINSSIQCGINGSGHRKLASDVKRLSSTSTALGADDYLPMFIYVLVQCGMVSAEIEADYIWALLHPSLLSGEAGYHLTTLSSAVHVLKNLQVTMEMTVDGDTSQLPCLGDMNGFMKVVIPDEKHDSIITKTLPLRPNMTAKDVCAMIAHKLNITNPQEHGLYVVLAGVEDRLQENSCPQSIKEEILATGKECVFAFKRVNAKFAWPKSFKS